MNFILYIFSACLMFTPPAFGTATDSTFIIHSQSTTYKLESVKKENTRLILYKAGKRVDSILYSDSIASISIVDIDNDGNEDVAVGIIKSSRWSKEKSLKMYLYRIKADRILPMWRSSKLTSNLIEFCFVNNSGKNYAVVIEKLSNNSYNLIRFRWKNFGLVYDKYMLKNQDFSVVFQRFGELQIKK